MPITIEGPPDPDAPLPPLWRRLLWFMGLAAAGSAAVAGVAYLLRAAILPD